MERSRGTTRNIYLATTDGSSLNKPEFFYRTAHIEIIEADDIWGFARNFKAVKIIKAC